MGTGPIGAFQILSKSGFPGEANKIWNGRLVRDLEDFDFLHGEIPRTREKSFPVQSGVVPVRRAKAEV
jgi:hypothetical protein